MPPLSLPCHDCEEWQHRRRIVRVWVVNNNAGSRPWDKEGGEGSSRPLNKGGRSPKKFFRPFGPHFGLKIRGGVGPPGLLSWIRHWIKLKDGPCTLSAAEPFIRSLDHLASLNKLAGSARRLRWTIRNVMGEGRGGEVQNKYSCKGEISWKIRRNVTKNDMYHNSLKFSRLLVSKCHFTDWFLNTTTIALNYSLICSAWKLSFNLLQLPLLLTFPVDSAIHRKKNLFIYLFIYLASPN